MPKKKTHTITELVKEPTLFQKDLPFDVTLHGTVIATVVKPKGAWYECENCGDNTQNRIDFKNNSNIWEEIILCDKCADELLEKPSGES